MADTQKNPSVKRPPKKKSSQKKPPTKAPPRKAWMYGRLSSMSTTEDVVKRARQLGIPTKGKLKSELITEIAAMALKKIREQETKKHPKKKSPPKKTARTFDTETVPKPGVVRTPDKPGLEAKGPVRSSVLTGPERSFVRALIHTSRMAANTALHSVYGLKLRSGRAAEEQELLKAVKRALDQWVTWDAGEEGPAFL